MLISDDKVKFGLLSGMSFRFQEQDNFIEYECAPLSGRETVRLNNNIVSAAKRYSNHSEHTFDTPEGNYRIELKSVGIRQGRITCTLIKNGKQLQSYAISRTYPRQWPGLLLVILAGVVLGFIQAVFGLTVWFTVLTLAPIVIPALWLHRGRWSYEVDA